MMFHPSRSLSSPSLQQHLRRLLFLLIATALSSSTNITSSVEDRTLYQQRKMKRNPKPSRTSSSTTTTTATTPNPPNSLCVIGCTPYVDFNGEDTGYAKFKALVREMVERCDVIVHVGDTKPRDMPCNGNLITKPLLYLKEKAFEKNKLVLYTPGDNEMGDCHRHLSTNKPSEFLKATDVRKFLIANLTLRSGADVTGRFAVTNHFDKNGPIPGSNNLYSYDCAFDKYLELDNFGVGTVEIPGSFWYLQDERSTLSKQDTADPLAGRLWMYLNAKDCALEWMDKTAQKASASGKKALFFLFQAVFYSSSGSTVLNNAGIGTYYNTANLKARTKSYTGTEIGNPYQPLFDKLTTLGLQYPNMMFYVVHSDGHKLSINRLNGGLNNKQGNLVTNHNVMVHQVDGDSRGLTMYSRFTVSATDFQPVIHQQQWSREAFDISPLGHSRVPY